MKEEAPLAPYKRANTDSLVAIVQNVGPDMRSFQANSVNHATALSTFVTRHRATPAMLGKQLCAVFGVEPYAPVVTVEEPDDLTLKLQKELAELESAQHNMRKEFGSRLEYAISREYDRGVRDGKKKRYAEKQARLQAGATRR